MVGLLLETLREPEPAAAASARAADQGVAVIALTVGGSTTGRTLVAAHSGALAGADGAWEALFEAYGVIRVADLDEMADTLELFGAGRPAAGGGRGIATVHDSGAERALVADVAESVGVPFATIGASTRVRLAALLDPGCSTAANPLDVWGTGAGHWRSCSPGACRAMADDENVAAVALAVDLVEEYDGDESYPDAVISAAAAHRHAGRGASPTSAAPSTICGGGPRSGRRGARARGHAQRAVGAAVTCSSTPASDLALNRPTDRDRRQAGLRWLAPPGGRTAAAAEAFALNSDRLRRSGQRSRTVTSPMEAAAAAAGSSGVPGGDEDGQYFDRAQVRPRRGGARGRPVRTRCGWPPHLPRAVPGGSDPVSLWPRRPPTESRWHWASCATHTSDLWLWWEPVASWST